MNDSPTPTPYPAVPVAQRVELLAQDGVPVVAHVFSPPSDSGPAIAQVVIHGATATPQSYYGDFATHLAKRGMRVVTYDYRGVGESRRGSLRGMDATMADWAELDATTVIRELVAPELPFLLVGHSFGGQIATVLPDVRQPDAIVLVGAQGGYIGSFDDSFGMWLRAAVATPVATALFGYLPGWLGTKVDLPKGVARQWMRWCLERDYFLSSHPHYGPRMASYDGEVLALSFTDDEFAPLANVLWLIDRMKNARLRHHHVAPLDLGAPGIGHFGAFRNTQRHQLWRTMQSYLELAAAGRVNAFAGPPDARDRRDTRFRIDDADIYADLAFGR